MLCCKADPQTAAVSMNVYVKQEAARFFRLRAGPLRVRIKRERVCIA